MPYTVNRSTSTLDMLMVCHHLDSAIAEDLRSPRAAFAAKPSRPKTCCTNLGADRHDEQRQPRRWARVGRGDHPHLADGAQDEGPARITAGDPSRSDNARVKRYIAKYTINPALANAIAHESLDRSRQMGDLVLWKPAFFGVKPSLVLKGGFIRGRGDGRPHASIPTPQPVHMRPMFGAFGGAVGSTSLSFVKPDLAAARRGRGLWPCAAARRGERLPHGDQRHRWCTTAYAPKMEIDAQPTACAPTGSCDLRAGHRAADGAAHFFVLELPSVAALHRPLRRFCSNCRSGSR